MKKGIKQKKKIILNILIFTLLILLKIDKAHALTFDELSYGAKVYFLNFNSSYGGKGYTIEQPNYGTEYGVFYKQMPSFTYGIGAGVYVESTLLPSNTYRITYVWSVPSGGCSMYSWSQFGVIQNLSQIGQQSVKSMGIGSMDDGTLIYDQDSLNVCVYSVSFVPDKEGSALVLPIKSGQPFDGTFVFYGYQLIDSGSGEVIKNTINDGFDSLKTQNETIINQNQQQLEQDKQQHDEFMNSDISEEDKQMPDDSKFQDYTDTENDLKDMVNQADLSVISIGIDSNSSSWVWNTLTRFIQCNSIVFGMFIAILSIGIIKLALGR